MIFVILLFSLILRLINLNQSLWLDEAVQAITAQKSFSYIFQEIVGDFHPPLYHFLMHFWVRVFGSGEIALRMPSVLFGVGTVYFVYLITKQIKNNFKFQISNFKFAEFSALLLATAPFHIYYSQEARMYSMACFLASLSMYFFMKISEIKDSKINTSFTLLSSRANVMSVAISRLLRLCLAMTTWLFNAKLVINGIYVLYFISAILMIYTDYYGFLVLLAQMIYLLIKKKYKFLILNSLFIILCYLPWIPMFITQIKTGMLATQTLPEWSNLVNVSFWKALPLTFIKFSIGRITIFNKSLYAGIVLVISLFYGSLFLKGIKGWLRETTVIMLWFIVPLAISWVVSLFIPNFQPFRLLLILPAFYLLLSMGIEGIGGNRWIKWAAITSILTINIISLSVYYFNPYFYREDWRGLVKYLQLQKDSVAVLPSSVSNWPIKYYDPDGKIKFDFVPFIGTSVYYIRYLVPVFDSREQILVSLNKEGYTKEKEISFNQLSVWKFKK